MEKTITDFDKLNFQDAETVKNHLVYIKDKNGVYTINPFIDTKKKLSEITNCTSLLLSAKNIAVIFYIFNTFLCFDDGYKNFGLLIYPY